MGRFQFEMNFTDVKRLKPDDDYKNWRGCKNKVQFRTQEAAEAARRNMPNAADLNTYECARCGGWKVGHKSGWREGAK